jgi:hypothetical protein
LAAQSTDEANGVPALGFAVVAASSIAAAAVGRRA